MISKLFLIIPFNNASFYIFLYYALKREKHTSTLHLLTTKKHINYDKLCIDEVKEVEQIRRSVDDIMREEKRRVRPMRAQDMEL